MIKKVKKVVGVDDLNEKLDRIIDAMATSNDIARLDLRMEKLERKSEERFHRVMTAIDGLVKVVTDMQREYAAVSVQLSRHEEWIRLIAKKSGVTLSF